MAKDEKTGSRSECTTVRREGRRLRVGTDMRRVRLSLIGVICVVAPIQAIADDLSAAPPIAPPRPAAKSKVVKHPATQGQSLR